MCVCGVLWCVVCCVCVCVWCMCGVLCVCVCVCVCVACVCCVCVVCCVVCVCGVLCVWCVRRGGADGQFYLRTLLIAKFIQHKTSATDEAKQKYLECNLSQCPSVHHKSLMNWSGIDEARPRATDTSTPGLTLFCQCV